MDQRFGSKESVHPKQGESQAGAAKTTLRGRFFGLMDGCDFFLDKLDDMIIDIFGGFFFVKPMVFFFVSPKKMYTFAASFFWEGKCHPCPKKFGETEGV